MNEHLPYRPCVGVMLVNRDGKVWVGQRTDTPDTEAWQMPQGGIDNGEDPADAAVRELREETGLLPEHFDILLRMNDTVRYDLPAELVPKLSKGQYRGQEQVWFLARLTADDDVIDLEADDYQEFACWKWADPEDLPDLIVPFKRRVYQQVLEEFRELI